MECFISKQIAEHCDQETLANAMEIERWARIDEMAARLINGENFTLTNGVKIDTRDLIDLVTSNESFYTDVMPKMVSAINAELLVCWAVKSMKSAIESAALELAKEHVDNYRLVGG